MPSVTRRSRRAYRRGRAGRKTTEADQASQTEPRCGSKEGRPRVHGRSAGDPRKATPQIRLTDQSVSCRGGCKPGDAAHENAFIVTSSASARASTWYRLRPRGNNAACSRKSSISFCKVWINGFVTVITALPTSRRERYRTLSHRRLGGRR